MHYMESRVAWLQRNLGHEYLIIRKQQTNKKVLRVGVILLECQLDNNNEMA